MVEEQRREKIHLVKWQTTLLSKKTGGLGIKNLRVQNKSLLSKWLWRFLVEDQASWRRAILNKYGQTEEWMSNVVDSTYGYQFGDQSEIYGIV